MKKHFTLFFILCVASDFAQNLTNGLQACYPLNVNAQNYAATGAALNGTLSNATGTVGHTGSSNTAFQLSGNVGSYIALPDNPGLKSDSVFFSGWFRIDVLPIQSSLEYLVYTSNGCASNFEAYSLHLYYETVYSQYVFCVSKCGTDCGAKPQAFSSIAPVAGNWYHVCFYIDNSVIKLYVNGALQSSAVHNVPFGYQAGKKVYLGVTNENNFNYPFQGAVDNVRIYNRELTQQEVTQLYVQDAACDAGPVSVIENSLYASPVNVYPNPSAGSIYVENLGENNVVIHDLLGRSVTFTKNQTADISEIHLQDAPPGVYFVRVVDPHGNYLDRIKLCLIK